MGPSLVKSMKLSWLIGGLVAAAVALVAGLAFMYNLPLDLRDRSPIQPIAFSHKLHAEDNGIPCLFCHRYAPKAKKLMEYWDNKEPVPWVRVYGVPDHVYFPHMMHIRAGLVCATCHGEVAAMVRITRSVKLKMGWCLNCHRQHKASIDCWTCHK